MILEVMQVGGGGVWECRLGKGGMDFELSGRGEMMQFLVVFDLDDTREPGTRRERERERGKKAKERKENETMTVRPLCKMREEEREKRRVEELE